MAQRQTAAARVVAGDVKVENLERRRKELRSNSMREIALVSAWSMMYSSCAPCQPSLAYSSSSFPVNPPNPVDQREYLDSSVLLESALK